MNFYTNTIAAIVALYHRFATACISHFVAKTETDFSVLRQELTQKFDTEVNRIRAESAGEISRIERELARHADGIKWLNTVKRHSPNVQGETPELLQ